MELFVVLLKLALFPSIWQINGGERDAENMAKNTNRYNECYSCQAMQKSAWAAILFGTALPSPFYNLMYTQAIPLHRQRRSQPRCFTLWAAHDPWQTLIKNPFDGPNESLSVSPISY